MNEIGSSNMQSIDSYSLINVHEELIKTFPQNFEISTNNGKYKFNKDVVELLVPNIKEALQENESLKEYHFDIDDEQNVMEKIKKLFKGEFPFKFGRKYH